MSFRQTLSWYNQRNFYSEKIDFSIFDTMKETHTNPWGPVCINFDESSKFKVGLICVDLDRVVFTS